MISTKKYIDKTSINRNRIIYNGNATHIFASHSNSRPYCSNPSFEYQRRGKRPLWGDMASLIKKNSKQEVAASTEIYLTKVRVCLIIILSLTWVANAVLFCVCVVLKLTRPELFSLVCVAACVVVGGSSRCLLAVQPHQDRRGTCA